MSAAAPIDFWFDFASPYGYFMSEKIDALAARHGRAVRWRPVLLFAVLRALALPAPLGSEPKRDYLHHDFERSARFLHVPFRLPDGFPATTQYAARAFYLIDAIEPPAAVRFAQAAMRAYFCDGAPIGELGFVAALTAREASALGDAAQVAAMLQGTEAKALLARAVDDAVGRRVFGSPFVAVDGECFFGVDRLPQIDALLAGSLLPAGNARSFERPSP